MNMAANEENVKGAADPDDTAEVILEESEERTEKAAGRADDETIEHRTSDETAQRN